MFDFGICVCVLFIYFLLFDRDGEENQQFDAVFHK
jgi:hypothetical protein